MNNSSDNIKNSVLEKIRQGDVRMRPKLYFTLKVVVVIIVAVLALIASAFVISFGFFSLHQSGELFLLGFGARGFVTFFTLFPWGTLVIAVVLVVLLEWLLRHFKFSYRQSILKIFFLMVLLVCAGGLLISVTPFHTTLLGNADRGELPLVGELYENIRTPHEERGEYRGVIISIATSTLTITHNDNDADVDDGTRIVMIPNGFDQSQLHVGDRVYVAGDMASGTVTAYGLQRF